MSGLELNKLAASILTAGLVIMTIGKITDALYKPTTIAKEGYLIEVPEDNGVDAATVAADPEEKIDIKALLASAEISSGEVLSKKCTNCHSFDKGGPNKVGPAMWGVFGRPKGSVPGYAYSKAMAEKGGNWNAEELFYYLKNPKGYIKGTKMAFAGFKKNEEAASMVAYLETLRD